MKEVFLIMDNPCDYESQPRSLGFKNTEEEAKEVVEFITERHKKLLIIREEFDSLCREYDQKNPIDYGSLPAKKVRTPWPSGLGKHQITAEMLKEKEEIAAFNKSVDEERNFKHNEWLSKKTEFLKKIIETKPKEFQDAIECGQYGYHFKSMPWLHKETPYFVEKLNEFITLK